MIWAVIAYLCVGAFTVLFAWAESVAILKAKFGRVRVDTLIASVTIAILFWPASVVYNVLEICTRSIRLKKPNPSTTSGFSSLCAYCGQPTSQSAYSFEGKSWPSCCSKDECIEKWRPLP